jgi:hypothetical protein
MHIADQQFRRGDFVERVTVRIDEEQVVAARQYGRQMIAHAFVHAEFCRHPETRREIDARFADRRRVEFVGCDFCTRRGGY